MENNSLLSVGHLCDEGYYVLFSISQVTIQDSKQKKPFERESGFKHWLMAHKFVHEESTNQQCASQAELSSK
jgi:hypothetical protein